MVVTPKNVREAEPKSGNGHPRFLYFAELLKRPVCAGSIRTRIGRLTDLVFAITEPFPEVVGLYLEHGWGKPTELIPWGRVLKIEDDAVFVQPGPEGAYPPFVDQPGWIMADKHLMGRTILDIDERRIEVVNDVRLLEARGKLVLVDVDISFNGFLRRWSLGWVRWIKEDLISWKYVQPLSLEDAVPTDRVKLGVTKKQLQDLPGEDLADALEELTGDQQQALFGALEPEKAAETLTEAEPRAQRQLSVNLTAEQASGIFNEMTVGQLANLFAALPHGKTHELLGILPADRAQAVRHILSERETTARTLMSQDFLARPKEARVGDVLSEIRRVGYERKSVSYIYVVEGKDVLVGVIDLRELVLSPDEALLGDIMASPVVTAAEEDLQDELTELFEKYEFRTIPVVDAQERILGVVQDKDVMKRPELRT